MSLEIRHWTATVIVKNLKYYFQDLERNLFKETFEYIIKSSKYKIKQHVKLIVSIMLNYYYYLLSINLIVLI